MVNADNIENDVSEGLSAAFVLDAGALEVWWCSSAVRCTVPVVKGDVANKDTAMKAAMKMRPLAEFGGVTGPDESESSCERRL